MAHQISIFPLEGTIQGINFYKAKGKLYARKATSLDKDRLNNDPAFKRTIENAKEFSGCMKVIKSIRKGLIQVIKQMSENTTFNRLTKSIVIINKNSVGERGRRNIDVAEHSYLLQNFEFVKENPFNSIFKGHFNIEISNNRNTSTLKISPFIPKKILKIPQGATHFRFLNSISILSNYIYDYNQNEYRPTNKLDNKYAFNYSEYFPINNIMPSNINIIAKFNDINIPEELIVINCIGIEFSQFVNSQQFLFKQGNSMQIKEIF